MKEKIKIGYVGLGARGAWVLEGCFRHMKDVEIPMICDLRDKGLEKGLELLREVGRPDPIMTKRYEDLLENPELDAIVLMTDWSNRAAMAEQSMRAGKYTAIEVGCAFDLSECYRLIDTYEETQVPLMMLENCCYGRREMMVMNVFRQGLFGEIVHCNGAYHHYLPEEDLLRDENHDPLTGAEGEKTHYRIQSYMHRNCDQYPTHALGPISKILGINRGNKMLTLSSHASKSRGLKAAAAKQLGADSPYAKMEYRQGDVVTTLIHCLNGETIRLTLDTTLPRPYYSRDFTVRGVHGMYTEERKLLYFDDMKENDDWFDNEKEMFEKYDHPLHREYVKLGERGGHGGIDWLVCRGFVESVKAGTNTPIDAYDTVAWMAIAPLSEASIAMGGAPVEVPDFTRGKWMNREPIVESKYCLDKICEDPTIPIVQDGE